MPLSDIVNVTIIKETAAVSRAGFGTPLILAYHTQWSERARLYTSIDGVEADGFAPGSAVHRAASAIFAQNPKVARIVVGRRANAPDRKVRLTPVAPVKASTVYAAAVNDQLATFTTDATPTEAGITAGLSAAINALVAAGVTATDSGPGTSILLDQDTPGSPFTVEVDRSLLTQKDETVDPGIVADLSAVRTNPTGNDDWYCLVTDAHSEAEINALAGSIETLRKLFLAACADDDILTSSITDLASDLKANSYARTALLWHTKPHDFPEGAWGGKLLPLDPGSETWKFKRLAGTTPERLTATEQANLDAKNANHYQTVAGINMTAEGVTASGEFIDITRFIDALTADIQEHVFARLAALSKIPFTDAGIAIIESEIRGALLRGVRVGGLAADPEPTVTVPRAIDVDPLDKNARLLRNVLFSAVLAGAIHKLIINGRVTV